MRYATLVALALVTLLALPVGSRAQEVPTDLIDRRVRIVVDGLLYQGTVSDASSGALVLERPGLEPLEVEWSAVERVEVPTEYRRWGRGALFGGLSMGIGFGALAESFASCFTIFGPSCDHEFHAEAFFGGLAVGGAVGAGVGVLIGGLVKSERWSPVVVPSAGPARGAWDVGLTLPVGERP